MTTAPSAPTSATQRRAGWFAGLLPFLSLLTACTSNKVVNPSFPLTIKQAKAELQTMRNEPVTLQRPVVVLGGWGDPLGMPPAILAKQLRKAIGDERIIWIGFGGCTNFDACRARLLKRLDDAIPSDDEEWTTEVDVVGFSMGGIVARYAAAPPQDDLSEDEATTDTNTKRLRIARLYTISTPHRGAMMANVIAPGSLAMNMRTGSEFFQQLDSQLESADYPIIPYVRLLDLTVGSVNAAPFDATAWWVAPAPFTRAHGDAYRDPRIIADIARRLRGETPYTTEPPTPLPEP